MAELKPQSETLDSESSVPPIVQHGLMGGEGVTPHQHLPGSRWAHLSLRLGPSEQHAPPSEQGELQPMLAAVRQVQMDGAGCTTSPGLTSPFLSGGVCS